MNDILCGRLPTGGGFVQFVTSLVASTKSIDAGSG